jgi:hypothetical protein
MKQTMTITMTKRIMAAVLVLGSASIAKADGFVCTSLDGDLKAQAYNHVDPAQGTRSPAVLVISDNRVQAGRKTIATFTDAKSTLSGGSFSYVGKVDLRVVETRRKGELIGGTRLGELDYIRLSVDHGYSDAPLADGDLVKGTLRLKKRNGDQTSLDMECARYLKS